MDSWRRSARKSRKEKVRHGKIRAIIEVAKDISEVTEKTAAVWTCKENARKQTAAGKFQNGNQRERVEKEEPKRDGWMG
jgi:hypothetical protein